MRSKNLDSRGNVGFNVINGLNRLSVDVPIHKYYNPDGSANYMNDRSKLKTIGSMVMTPHRGFVGPQGFHGGSQAEYKYIEQPPSQ